MTTFATILAVGALVFWPILLVVSAIVRPHLEEPVLLSPWSLARLEHEALEPRSIEAWGHPEGCGACFNRSMRERQAELLRSDHGVRLQAKALAVGEPKPLIPWESQVSTWDGTPVATTWERES